MACVMDGHGMSWMGMAYDVDGHGMCHGWAWHVTGLGVACVRDGHGRCRGGA
jgi:hypothetical protein